MTTAAAETATVTLPANAVPSIDPYLMRGLLWCAHCTTLMAPGDPILDTSKGSPVWRLAYTCGGCDRKADAGIVDETVWRRVIARANVRSLAPQYRQWIVRQMLAKVNLTIDGRNLQFLWSM
ncbi:hypothetical protein Ait01nite_020370 [Actinoplanes italicus]|uniref:Uncharacterized protein n=1 Tax=Actinoplanes italicus TaxID=113567 RepID=A0A2T0KP88_9ACTN|nr:hypothetical protein [Actinoplanes italicus]PRX25564.1 hypothetical protein CLV67_101281 [Actinoplanes italicus]GIE28992.1 hypothetical protein Ait01nite_020370 [Actinoplanes italicus]